VSAAVPAVSAPAEALRWGTPAARWVLLATILGSGLAGIDATVVNVALPTIGADFGASFASLQWVVTAYTLTLASLILLGGSLGDRFGRRRVFVVGVTWFAVASLLCGLAPSAGVLIACRAVQGVGAALLTPGSLAMLQSSFAPADRARAIGAWSGLGGVATAVGPLLGGYLVEAASWRWVFLVNVPLAALVVLVARRHVPETHDPTAHGRVDVAGAALGAVGLAGLTSALIGAPAGAGPDVVLAAVVGVAGLGGFLLVERRSAAPMLPLAIFSSRVFSAVNGVTFAVYAALGAVFLLLVVALQTTAGFSPLAAGSALLPVTVVMLLLSARAGALAQRTGPRLPLTLGPLVCAAGVLLMLRVGAGASYAREVLPAVTVFGLGLALLVAPLTSTVLAAADARHAGLASGVNNAVARAAGLLAVAVVPAAAGLTGDVYRDPVAFAAGFRTALLVCAGLLVAASVLAAATVGPGHSAVHRRNLRHCAVDGTPLAAPAAVAGPAAADPTAPGPTVPRPGPSAPGSP